MRYEDVRLQIQTGDILSCQGTAIYSNIIRKWGGLKNWFWRGDWKEDQFTHTGIAIWIQLNGDDRLCILEAHIFKGIRLNPLSEVLKEYWKPGGRVYWQAVHGIDGTVVAQEALKNWTKAYPSLFQFLIAGSSVARWIRKRVFRKGADTNGDKYHCSELASRSLIHAGFKWNMPPAATTPQMVSEFSCLTSPVELEA